MQTIKEKVSNAASSGKAHVDIYKAKAQEKAEKATARSEGEKEIAHQLRKAKEGQAKMELHQAKAEHAAEKLRANQSHLLGHHHPNLSATHDQYGHNRPLVGTAPHHHPLGTVAPNTGTTLPTYPLAGNPTPPGHKKHTYL